MPSKGGRRSKKGGRPFSGGDEPSKRGEQSVHGKPNAAESNANVGLWVMSMSFLKALIKIAILQNRLIREIRSLFIKLTRLMQRFDEFAHGWAGFG